jgi:hypothetical protein
MIITMMMMMMIKEYMNNVGTRSSCVGLGDTNYELGPRTRASTRRSNRGSSKVQVPTDDSWDKVLLDNGPEKCTDTRTVLTRD